MKKIAVLAISFTILFTSFVYSDVKYVSTTLFNLEGAAGAMLKFFGAAKPIKTVDYYKGNVKRSDTFDKKGKLKSTAIIDLDKELFINIDHEEKTYTQMTFDEWRQMIESALEGVDESEYGDVEAVETEEPEAEVKWDLKVDVKETGEKETVAGKKCEKVILTLDMDAEVTSESEEGQEPETAKGGMVVTSTQWLYKGEDKAKREMDDFNKKLAEKLGVFPGQDAFKDMMAQIMQSNSQLGEAIEKMKQESKKLNGLAMRSHTVYETKVDPETVQKLREEKAKQEQEEKMEIPTSVGGLLGGFGKKMMKKHIQKDDQVKERNTLMTSSTEVLELDTSPLSDALFISPPKGYKLIKRDEEQ